MKFFKPLLLFLFALGDLLSAQTANTIKNTPCATMNTKYKIIYINGPSSSGKTTLAQLLQQELDPPFLHIGIDRVIGMMPDKLNDWEGGPYYKFAITFFGVYPTNQLYKAFGQPITDTNEA